VRRKTRECSRPSRPAYSPGPSDVVSATLPVLCMLGHCDQARARQRQRKGTALTHTMVLLAAGRHKKQVAAQKRAKEHAAAITGPGATGECSSTPPRTVWALAEMH